MLLPWIWSLESKVLVLSSSLPLVVCVVLTLLTHFPSRRFHQTTLHHVIQINQWKASAAAVKSKNDEENFEIRIELEETSEIHLLNKESKRTKKK